MKQRSLVVIPLLAAVLAFLLPIGQAKAGTSSAPILTAGAVVALSGTPHLFVAGDGGVLHWAADTRALAGKDVNWNLRSEVSLDELKGLQRGDPWLSAGLLKNGDPIYLVKWETGDTAPTLLQIQSIADVELFGINGSNYGTFVLDRSAWEQRYGFSFDALQKGVLPAATIAATPTPAPTTVASGGATATATPGGMTVTLKGVSVSGDAPNQTVVTSIDVNGLPPRTRALVTLVARQYICSPGCTDTQPVSWGPTDRFGDSSATGYLSIQDTHPPYSESTYTIRSSTGQTVTLKVDDDFKNVS